MKRKITCPCSAGAMLFALLLSAQSAAAEESCADRVSNRATLLLPEQPRLESFRQGLRALGHIEGQNIVIEFRHTDGKFEQLPDVAAELVRLKVDVLVATTTNAALAAKNATRTIPIVFIGVSDPVAAGLVDSLARPGETSRD